MPVPVQVAVGAVDAVVTTAVDIIADFGLAVVASDWPQTGLDFG